MASSAPATATWRQKMYVGMLVDAQDSHGDWCEAIVKSVSEKSVRIHFRGRPDRENTSFPVDSPALASAYKHVRKWRDFKVGDQVQMGTVAHKQTKTVWCDAIVEKVSEVTTTEDGPPCRRVRVRAKDTGEARWLDPQSEFLCRPGTHNVFISSATLLEIPNSVVDDDEEEEEVAHGDQSAKDPWRDVLNDGALVEVQDAKLLTWSEARVVLHDGDQIIVRYCGWPWSYDETLRVTSDRLARPGMHLGSWREFQCVATLQLGFRVSECADTASHWVNGKVVRTIRNTTTKKFVRILVEYEAPDGSGPKREWRDVDDDFLAPQGAATFQKKTRSRDPPAKSAEPDAVQTKVEEAATGESTPRTRRGRAAAAAAHDTRAPTRGATSAEPPMAAPARDPPVPEDTAHSASFQVPSHAAQLQSLLADMRRRIMYEFDSMHARVDALVASGNGNEAALPRNDSASPERKRTRHG